MTSLWNSGLTVHHVGVGAVGDGEDVRRHLVASFALVDGDGAVGVDGEPLVRVDGHAEQARVGVDQLDEVALLQVVEHRSVVEVGQVGHVLAFLVLGRVHLGHLLLLEVLLLCAAQRRYKSGSDSRLAGGG